MIKPDDSSLDPNDLRAVEERAGRLLDSADAWDRYPIPIKDILAAAKIQVAPTSAFDRAALLAYIKDKSASTGALIKSAITKVLGLYDASENLIHIDDSVGVPKQIFLKTPRNWASRDANPSQDISVLPRLQKDPCA